RASPAGGALLVYPHELPPRARSRRARHARAEEAWPPEARRARGREREAAQGSGQAPRAPSQGGARHPRPKKSFEDPGDPGSRSPRARRRERREKLVTAALELAPEIGTSSAC